MDARITLEQARGIVRDAPPSTYAIDLTEQRDSDTVIVNYRTMAADEETRTCLDSRGINRLES